MDDDRTMVAEAVARLRAGQRPQAAAYGSYRDGIAALEAALHDDGIAGVERAYQQLCRLDPAWIAAGAFALVDTPPVMDGVPPLPEAAQAVMACHDPAGTWLDSYLAYAQQAVPMSPAVFHEAAGLFLLSTAVARRAYVQSGAMTIWPSLWYLCVAPPGKYRKSAQQSVAELVLESAGMGALRLQVDSLTPEALINLMNPEFLKPTLREADRADYLQRRRWANTRGWINDETHQLLQAAERDYNAELLPMLLKLYNGQSYTKATGSRGEETITQPYLAILGASTPGSMARYLSRPEHWESGMWSRFILLKPDAPSEWAVEIDDATPPSDLVDRLRAIHGLFPSPHAELVIDSDKKQPPTIGHTPAPATCLTVAREAWQAWQTYRKALEFDAIPDDGESAVPDQLAATYIRLPGVAMRIAILLAVADAADAKTPAAQVTIGLAHYARAQRITERYRATLHSFYAANVRTEESTLQQRILKYLTKSRSPLTQYTLCELTRTPAKAMAAALEGLRTSGKVVTVEEKAKNGRTVVLWALV